MVDGASIATIHPSTSRLFRCYKVVNAMLRKRGYMVQSEHLNMTPQSFVEVRGDRREGDKDSLEDRDKSQ
jgi:hypothetical protein